MQIAICDDEVSMVQILEKKIKKLLPDAVIDKYLSGDELIASGSKPDILFLDIQMPGMDGMETAKVLRQDNEDMILIFVTAAEAYVFQAFDVGAFHYLVKPFSDEKFKEVVTKAVHNIKRSSRLEKDEKYIMVQTAGSHIKIFLRDIVYAEVCKDFGVPLLVDNAHGAYLRFLPQGGQHPIALGAAMCCDSGHKTLPVVTGGAYLHLGKNAPIQDEAAVRNALADRKSTRLNSSHNVISRMPSSA